MIYLKVAHSEDVDADYFCFNSLRDAVHYLMTEAAEEWVMSDIPFEELPLSDYTFISDN